MPILRIATLAHGHPSLSSGGAEIAAQSLHRELQALPAVQTLHVSCAPATSPVAAVEGELIIETAGLDPLRLTRRDPRAHRPLVDQVGRFAPDVVHFHHVLGFGADALLAVRRELPDAVIVVTLHEYIAICHRQGQMVRIDGALCEAASPAACSSCFPEIAPRSFLARAEALQALLSVADGFVAPSAFLARRYIEWGLPPEKFAVLENVTRSSEAALQPPVRTARRGRFAFFGQINPFKGIDLLLEAVALVPEADWEGSSLDIHGSGLERQPLAFQERIATLVAATGGRATLHGAYVNDEIPALMADADWVVVPSIWWENSPVVIQEAFRSFRPVIAGDIGGMAEKVRDGVDGLLFQARDAADLAACLATAADGALWSRLQGGVTPPPAAATVARAHIAFYEALRAARH